MSRRPNVIIVGGGFGGLCAAQALKSAPVDVTLIDRNNYHLFQPLLYQVATGSLSAGEIAAPLRSVLSRQKNARVLLGAVVDIDPIRKHVLLADGADFEYDWLIVATGSQSAYYGHEAWREWAPSLKSVEEAIDVRHKILYAFEVAERIGDPAQRRAWLTFVIVGAGPTGVELAGAIAEIARQTLKNDFRSIDPKEAQIILMDSAARVLPPFPVDLAEKAKRSLVKLGVEVRTGVMVKDIDKEGLTLQTHASTNRLEARTVIDRQKRKNQGRFPAHGCQLPGPLRYRRSRSCSESGRDATAWRCAGCDATRNLCSEGDHRDGTGRTEAGGLQVFR